MSVDHAEPDVAYVFGRTLRRLRRERDITQLQLAHASGLDRTYVSSLERGRYNPTLEAVMLLAHALGMSAAEFVAEIERATGPVTRRSRRGTEET